MYNNYLIQQLLFGGLTPDLAREYPRVAYKERDVMPSQDDGEDAPPVVYGYRDDTDPRDEDGDKKKDPPVAKLRDELLKAFMAVPDKPFCNGTAEGKPPVILVAKDSAKKGQQLVPATLAQLEALGKPAQCGRGEETVTDPTVRSTTVIKPPAVTVEWPGLESVLELVRRQQACGPLRAELHDVLVYGDNDFFKEHRDSKKMPQHIMTLVVECSVPLRTGGAAKKRMTPTGGSRLRFFAHQLPEDSKEGAEGDASVDEDDDPRVIEEWEGTNAGDWCCWYCTQPHEVLPLNRKGVRVAAVFNVMACATDATASVKQLPAPEVCLTDPYLALSVSPALDVLNCCESLIGHLRKVPTQRNQEPLDHVGFLLWHPYARDVPPAQVPDRRGELPPPLQVPVEHLRGRDVFLVDALRQVTSQTPCLIQTHVMMEVHQQELDAEKIVHLPLDVLPGKLAKDPAHKPVKKRSEFNDHFTYHTIDFPEDNSFPAVTRRMPPLIHGLPAKYAADLCCHRSPSSWSNLWGNMGYFKCYWYHSVMAVVSLNGDDPTSSFLQRLLRARPKKRGCSELSSASESGSDKSELSSASGPDSDESE